MKQSLKAIIFATIFVLTNIHVFGNAFSMIANSNSIVLPTVKKEKVSQKEKLLDFYKKLDLGILKSGDEKAVKTYLVGKNKEIFSYLKINYPKLGSLDGIDINDEDFIVFGLVYALAEHGGYLQPAEARAAPIPGWLQCVGGVLGVTGIYDLFTGAATATYASTWALIKKLVKRYVGWLGVGLALWEIATECF